MTPLLPAMALRPKGGPRVFGQTMSSSYRRQMNTNNAAANNDSQSNDNGSNTAAIAAARRKTQIDATDAKFKYDCYQCSNDPNALQTRPGWIFNMAATTLRDEASGQDFSGLDMYMVHQTGETFKCTVIHNPYLSLHNKGEYNNNNINNFYVLSRYYHTTPTHATLHIATQYQMNNTGKKIG